jgi:hypothetical protein
MRKSNGFRTIGYSNWPSIVHLGKPPEPVSTHDFFDESENKYSIVSFAVALQGGPVRNALIARYFNKYCFRNSTVA